MQHVWQEHLKCKDGEIFVPPEVIKQILGAQKMKPSFELSRDTERLVEFLANRQQASYRELSVHVQRQLTGRDRYVLSSARRVLEKRGVFFAVERGVGLTRASNGQVATLSTSDPIEHVKRTTTRAQRRQAHVNVQALTAEERLAFDIGRSIIEAIRNTTRKSLRTVLAKEIEQRDGGVVSINSVLALPRHRRKAAS